MTKPLLLSLLLLSIALPAVADDQTQSVQQALKEKGFYFGAVDGQPGPETESAIKRYQIRQGLEVTGKLDSPTLSSLDIDTIGQTGHDTLQAVPPPSAAAPEPAQPTPREEVQSDHDLLRSPAPQPQAQPQEQTEPPQAQEPPSQAPEPGQTLPPQYSSFFRRTPYETAPPVVQRSIVQRAKQRLAGEGFYRGVSDSQLTPDFTRALSAYQQDAELPPTARLDLSTLAELNLLPRRRFVGPPASVPYYYGAPPPVYRGIWIHP